MRKLQDGSTRPPPKDTKNAMVLFQVSLLATSAASEETDNLTIEASSYVLNRHNQKDSTQPDILD